MLQKRMERRGEQEADEYKVLVRFITEHLPESPELKIEYKTQDSDREHLEKISPDLVKDKIFISGSQTENGLTYVVLQPDPEKSSPSARFHFWPDRCGIFIFEEKEVNWKSGRELDGELNFLHGLLEKLL